MTGEVSHEVTAAPGFPELTEAEREHNCPNTLAVLLTYETAADPANAGLYPEGVAEEQQLRMLQAHAIIKKALGHCPGRSPEGVCPLGSVIWDAVTLTRQTGGLMRPSALPSGGKAEDHPHGTGQYL